MAGLDKPKNVGVGGPGIASSPIMSHLMQHDATLDKRLDAPEHTAIIILPADFKIAEGVEFDETNVIPLFKKKNYQVHMRVGNTSNMSIWTVSVFNTSAVPNLFSISLLSVN